VTEHLDCEVVVTRSGAEAIRDKITGQLMHPVVGPGVESERLYVGPSRLRDRVRERRIVVLDVGLGAASNAIAAWRVAAGGGHGIDLVSFDRSTAALALALDHASAFGLVGEAGDAARTILARGAHEAPHARWRFVLGDVTTTLDAEAALDADVVYWDPFSPRVNAELWTMRAFAALRRHCADGATVHTYSGATSTRSALALAGFAIGEGVALDDGRTTTVAATRPDDLARPFDRRWLDRVARSSAPFPPDAPPDALERIRGLPQF
jgi:queuine tRNA-ribosyltransferase